MKKEEVAHLKGYRISQEGVPSSKRGERKVRIKSRGNYKTKTFKIRNFEGKEMWISVHRLQAYQKYGKKMYEEGVVVRHLDGDSLNNHWDNIAIGTQSENMMDIPQEKRRRMASNPKHDHEKIIADWGKGMKYSSIMEKHNISSAGTVSFIINKSLQKDYTAG